jgi:hypothetical protein
LDIIQAKCVLDLAKKEELWQVLIDRHGSYTLIKEKKPCDPEIFVQNYKK